MRRIPLRPLLLAAALTALAGCGSSPPAEETTVPSTQHGAFAHCLAEHGVTGAGGAPVAPPMGPGAPPAGVDPSTWERAVQACGGPGPGPGAPAG